MTYRSEQGLVHFRFLTVPQGRRAEVALNAVQGSLLVRSAGFCLHFHSVAWGKARWDFLDQIDKS